MEREKLCFKRDLVLNPSNNQVTWLIWYEFKLFEFIHYKDNNFASLMEDVYFLFSKVVMECFLLNLQLYCTSVGVPGIDHLKNLISIVKAESSLLSFYSNHSHLNLPKYLL